MLKVVALARSQSMRLPSSPTRKPMRSFLGWLKRCSRFTDLCQYLALCWFTSVVIRSSHGVGVACLGHRVGLDNEHVHVDVHQTLLFDAVNVCVVTSKGADVPLDNAELLVCLWEGRRCLRSCVAVYGSLLLDGFEIWDIRVVSDGVLGVGHRGKGRGRQARRVYVVGRF